MKFQVKDSIVISDPCVPRSDSRGFHPGNPFKAKPGTWIVKTEPSPDDGRQMGVCTVVHEDHVKEFDSLTPDELGIYPVASGQLGIFSNDLYPEGEVGNLDGSGSFYDRVCGISLGYVDKGNKFGVIDGAGFVTATEGDGAFHVYHFFSPTDPSTLIAAHMVIVDEGDDFDDAWSDAEAILLDTLLDKVKVAANSDAELLEVPKYSWGWDWRNKIYQGWNWRNKIYQGEHQDYPQGIAQQQDELHWTISGAFKYLGEDVEFTLYGEKVSLKKGQVKEWRMDIERNDDYEYEASKIAIN